MSIELDKNKGTSTVILTLLKDSDAKYVMELHSAYTHKTYEITLGPNFSQHIDRYDEFHVNLQSFEKVEAGRYQYKVFHVVGLNRIQLAEVGVAMVMETASLQNELIAIAPEETDDDVIVYEN